MQSPDELRAQQVVEEAFLSPRVVDAGTLREFGESLRDLLRRAAEQREALRQSVTEGERVGASLRETTGQATEKLRPAVKLIPTIDGKLEQAERALERATRAAETAHAAAIESSQAATAEGIDSLRQAEAALQTAIDRARALEGRLGQITGRAEMAVQLLDEECRTRLEGAAKHAQDVLGTMVAELDARAEEAIGRLSSLLDDHARAAEAALDGPISLSGEGPRTDTREEGVADATLSNSEADMSEAIAAAQDQLERVLESVRARVLEEAEGLEARAAESRRAADEAEGRLARVREELSQIDRRGQEIAGAASQALGAFDEEIGRRMQAVREMMEQLASVSGQAERAASAAEVKPAQAAPQPKQYHRIDRPAAGEAGLPGRLRF